MTRSVFVCFLKKRRRQRNTYFFSKTVICYEMSSAAHALRKYRSRGMKENTAGGENQITRFRGAKQEIGEII